MSVWTLSDIRQKVRKVTGRFTANEMTNTELDDRINRYYTLIFPAEVKLDAKLVFYSFVTTANQAFYDVPITLYTNFSPPATINNLKVDWYQNPTKFRQDNIESALQYQFSNPWTGDGVLSAFSTTITGFPIFPGSLTISDDTETFRDTSTTYTESDVVLTGSAGGTATINYSTGTVSVTFNSVVDNGQLIHLNYIVFKAGRPTALLYFEKKFELLPPPDQAYIVKMQAYQVVTALSAATDTPDLNEWGPAIAYGTARDIFADFGENDAYQQTTVLYKEQIDYILTRTEQDLSNVRALPNF